MFWRFWFWGGFWFWGRCWRHYRLVSPEVDLPEAGRFFFAGVSVRSGILVFNLKVVLDWILEEMLKDGDVAGVFLTTCEEAVKLDEARLVVFVAVSALNHLDVDSLFRISGFGKVSKTEVSHHTVDEAFAFQRPIISGLGADPYVWNVEGEAFDGHSSNFPAAAELLLDGRDVSSIISGRSTSFKHSSTFVSFTGLLTVLSFVMFVRFWLAARSLLFSF